VKIPCLWYRGSQSSWCHALPKWLMQSASYEHFTRYADVPSDGAIVVIKADEVDSDELSYDLARFKWLLLMVCSNEEAKWDSTPIQNRPRLHTKVWLQTPAPHQRFDRAIPWGWAADCVTGSLNGRRSLDWFFSGQVTHARRTECVDALSACDGKGVTVCTRGFSQGLPRDIYLQLMERSKMAPCPSGPVTVDSFRVCEALEMGAVPIVDLYSPVRADPLYWEVAFGEWCPLPTIEDWANLPALMEEWLCDWESRAAKIFAWYGNAKMKWRRDLLADVEALRVGR
jgi:hypothetical protein